MPLLRRLLPAALSYLILRVSLTLARALSSRITALPAGIGEAAVYILVASLGYAAAIALLRRYMFSADTEAGTEQIDSPYAPFVSENGHASSAPGEAELTAIEGEMPASEGEKHRAYGQESLSAARESRRRLPAPPARLLIAAAGTFLLFALSLFCSLLPGGNYPSAAGKSAAAAVVETVRMGIFPAICEELYYRGALYDGMRAVCGKDTTAAVCVALLFAVSHCGGGISAAVFALLSSPVLSYLRKRCGGVGYSAAAHMIYNSAVILFAALS